MARRLSPIDASFLYLERPTTPMHAGGVAIFEMPDSGFDYDRLVRLVRQRIALVPRYRQRIREVPLRIARPVWVDDEHFDINFHVRRTAIPKPGSDDQLHEIVSRLMVRPLDRSRPLWEMYLVDGLSGGRFAIVTKTHEALVDGLSAVDIAQVMLSDEPLSVTDAGDSWNPEREPSDIELASQALTEILTRPAAAIDAVRDAVGDVSRAATTVAEAVDGVLSAIAAVVRPPMDSPLNVAVGQHRLFRTVEFALEDFRLIRSRLGGTVNDALLAVVTGGLRSWLQARGEGVSQPDHIRALLPISVAVPVRASGQAGGSRVSANLIDLPIGEADPAVRLQQVGFELAQLSEGGQFVGAEDIVNIAGFGPPTLHSLGARVAAGIARKVYNIVITNVPGPQHPLYLADARLVAAYPVVPLTSHQALSIGITSYDGRVFLGLYVDREALPDVDLLASCLDESMEELMARSTSHRRTLTIVSDDDGDERALA